MTPDCSCSVEVICRNPGRRSSGSAVPGKMSLCFPASLVPTPLRPLGSQLAVLRPPFSGLFFLPVGERALVLAPRGCPHQAPAPGGFTQHTRILSKFWEPGAPMRCLGEVGALVRLVPCAMALRRAGGGGGKSWWHLDLSSSPPPTVIRAPRAGPLLPGAQSGLLLLTTRDALTTCRTTSLPSTSACHSVAFFSSRARRPMSLVPKITRC